VPDHALQKCILPECGATFGIEEVHHACPKCGNLLDVAYDWGRMPAPTHLPELTAQAPELDGWSSRSGVWRYRAMIDFAPDEALMSMGEGATQLRPSPGVAAYVGLAGKGRVECQYEGFNPSGSFKDNGMAGAFTHARMVGARTACCASTGNTSASLAAFASATRQMEAVVFIGRGKIALGKLSQALEYGARTVEIEGDFDDAMARVMEASKAEGLYLVNSVNPFRLEGQKTIMYRILEARGWRVPDWIVCPGGNLGNSSAFGKAYIELVELGLIRRPPRLAVINAEGAPTLSVLVNERNMKWNGGAPDMLLADARWKEMDEKHLNARTLASAIEINRPVNLTKCLRALEATDGVVRTVSDEEILDAKAVVGREGVGCEPASAASVAGARRLVEEGVIDRDAEVVCVLTGHALKAPNATVGYHAAEGSSERAYVEGYGVKGARFANRPVRAANDLDAILKALKATR